MSTTNRKGEARYKENSQAMYICTVRREQFGKRTKSTIPSRLLLGRSSRRYLQMPSAETSCISFITFAVCSETKNDDSTKRRYVRTPRTTPSPLEFLTSSSAFGNSASIFITSFSHHPSSTFPLSHPIPSRFDGEQCDKFIQSGRSCWCRPAAMQASSGP